MARPRHRKREESNVAKEKTLSDAFYETLKDVYYAEKQSVRALTKSAKAAKASELKQAFETHRDESGRQVERLEQVFEILGKPARAKTCEAMQGIVHEMQEDLEDFGSTSAADAVLIGCAQAVEHYEIARYGMLKTWARQLGLDDAAKLLDETLQEEKATDEKLTQIAENAANAQAGSGEADDDDEDEEEEEDAEAKAELSKSDDGGKAPTKKPSKSKAAA
jgi:ferritin-like metal-binding protein YciE